MFKKRYELFGISYDFYKDIVLKIEPNPINRKRQEFVQRYESIYETPNYTPEVNMPHINKGILNFSIGWMQSWKPDQNRFAEWAHLSKDAIADNNKRIIELTIRLQSSGTLSNSTPCSFSSCREYLICIFGEIFLI